MGRLHVTALVFARYAGIKESDFIRAICNRGAIEGIALPEALDHSPLSSRVWLREDVVLFTHRLQRVRGKKSVRH
ncbi:hypothetical protein ACFSFZ_13660 [Mixta tenebrionis]|uniref:DNA-binding protein n=1 Tax=Mixta tenebrionis TaxID=2562439 RepID=A0A506VE15_9GAMM|nr:MULTISPECIES: hypothetical protein [Mixta]QHM75822.1 hypothetical protein C7M52_01779 [Mixta theicola]TPW44354.1 hypothetical protein FKM52_01180 [Mixta tenebrionis]